MSREQYALGLLVEEMGESLQLIGKALRFGLDTPGIKRLDGTIDMTRTPRTMLPIELGDVLASIQYACEVGVVDQGQMDEAFDVKFEKLTNPASRDNLGRRLAPAPSEEIQS